MSAATEPDAVVLPSGALECILRLVAEPSALRWVCDVWARRIPDGTVHLRLWTKPGEMFDGLVRLPLT
jgi:hypothetical protein